MMRAPDTEGAGYASDILFFFHTGVIKYGDEITPKDKGMGRTISAYNRQLRKDRRSPWRGLAQMSALRRGSDGCDAR